MKVSPWVMAMTLMAPLVGCSATKRDLLLHEPTLEQATGESCDLGDPTPRPLLVDWPSAERVKLERRLKESGVVPVAYADCEVKVLADCRAPGEYRYVGFTAKRDAVKIRNGDELRAALPLGAAGFEARLRQAGELTVSMSVIGRHEGPATRVVPGELEGDCRGATHLISGVSVGAFRFQTGAEGEASAQVASVAGAKSGAGREVLAEDGDPSACIEASAHHLTPPFRCSSLLRLELSPLAEGAAPSRSFNPTSIADLPLNDELCAAKLVEMFWVAKHRDVPAFVERYSVPPEQVSRALAAKEGREDVRRHRAALERFAQALASLDEVAFHANGVEVGERFDGGLLQSCGFDAVLSRMGKKHEQEGVVTFLKLDGRLYVIDPPRLRLDRLDSE